MRTVALMSLVFALALGVAAPGTANPTDPWRSVAWAKAYLVSQHEGSPACYGLAPAHGHLFRFFRCVYSAHGDRWKEILHSSGLESWVENARSGPRLLADRTAYGDFATATASANDSRPGLIAVRISSGPDQRVDIYWTVTCSHGYSARSRSGHFVAYDREDTVLNLPFDSTVDGPDECVIAAAGSLTDGGWVEVQIVDLVA